jgi:spore coat-associated protein N
MKLSKKRVALAVGVAASIGAIATLASGTTFGLYSASETGSGNSFTSGTVTVGTGTPTSVTCTITNMVPGDSSAGSAIGSKADTTCTYNVKYTGSAPAWLAVDVAVSNGSTTLYDGTATGLQLYLNDANSTYLTSAAPTAGTTYKTAGGAAATLPATGIQDLLVSTAAVAGTSADFTLDYALPIASGNIYQGGSATVTLTFHAVLAGTNSLPGTCTSAGQQCLAGDGFAWS